MPAFPGYNAKFVINGTEMFYADISPADQGDSLDVSVTGVDARKKRRIVGQVAGNMSVSLVWDPEDNPGADPPDFVAGTVLEDCDWYPDRDDSRHIRFDTMNVVAASFKGPVADAIRWDLTLESAEDYNWVE